MVRWRRVILISLAVLALAGAAGLSASILIGLPDPRDIETLAPSPSTFIFDRNGNLLYEYLPETGGKSEPVALGDMPEYLLALTLATEDAHFYEHPGVDLWAIARSAYYGVRYGRFFSGGSTITQQLARNLLLREERQEHTLRRKLREAVLALIMDYRYSKEEILALYLNSTDYGRQAFGVQAAAKAYFGKPVSSLDLAECAFLAGMPQAPSLYDPSVGDAWKDRMLVVLDLAERQGVIPHEQAEEARREPLSLVPQHHSIRAPHFVMYVLDELARILGPERLKAGDLYVYTTLDLAIQERVQETVQRTLANLNEVQARTRPVRADNAAVLALNVDDGAVLVMLGSPDYFDETISGAVNGVFAMRQPGSAIKPLTYAAAFEQDYTPATMLLDVPSSFLTVEGQPYSPINYDFKFRGPVLLREALASSYNVIAVKVLEHVGIPALVDMARRLGITSLDRAETLGLAVTLGGAEVSLMELTSAYSAFAREGSVLKPHAIDLISNSQGDVIWEMMPAQPRQALSPQVAYLITDILSDDKARIPTFGEGSVLSLPFPAAVKTGTTTDYRDNWTIGYSPQVTVGVWVGNADGGSMGRVSGVEGAAPIWRAVMEMLHRQLPREDFVEPPDLVRREVCAVSGLLPGSYCVNRRMEVFIAGTEPTRECNMHQAFEIDVRTGYLSDDDTPEEYVLLRPFLILPLEAAVWAEEQGIPRPPQPSPEASVRAENLTEEEEERVVSLTEPHQGSSYLMAPDLPGVAQQIQVQAAVGSGVRLGALRLLVDGIPIAVFSQPPYRALWALEPGEHVFTAELTDIVGSTWLSTPVRIYVGQAPH